ncbi:MAG TPA: hypothetical protein VIV34_03625 [Pseudolabrys sp.]
MKALICGAATALALLSSAALADDKTLDPNGITVDASRPQLQLSDQQRAAIQDALETVNTEQKTPPKFEAKVGEAVPLTMTLDVMPESLIQREPSLKQYGYAKLAKDVLVIDPMKKTIIAVLPRKSPSSGKDVAPADWAAQRGRELTGQQPESTGSTTAPEPAGDSGDKKNGNEATANEK